jgi:hypothetical protein
MNKDIGKAEKILIDSIRLDPKSEVGLFNLGVVYYK